MQSLNDGQEVSDGASSSQVDEQGLETQDLVVRNSTSELLNNFFEDLEDLLSERVAIDLDDAVVVVDIVVLVFLPRGGSRGENLTADRVGGHANGTQARVGSNRGCRGRSRSERQTATLNLCCQSPGEDWVYDPLGMVSTTARGVVEVIVVTVLF